MTATDVLTWVSNLAFLLASVAALRLWVRHRSSATWWLSATFVAFAVIISSSLLPEAVTANQVVGLATVVLLVAAPYTLFRFAEAVVGGATGLRRTAEVLLALLVVSIPVILSLLGNSSEDGGGLEGLSAPEMVWVLTFLAYWLGTNATAGWLLIRASFGEPGVVRNRLRVLGVAALGLGLVIVLSVFNGDGAEDEVLTVFEAIIQLGTAGLGLLFLVGFAPPNLLKAAWRERDERRLYEAAVGLMGAQHPDEVAAVVVPGVRTLMGAPSVVMRSANGEVMARAGAAPTTHGAVREVRHRTIGSTDLEVVVAPTMPVFGADETQHLDRLALLAELALDRVRLLEAERAARDDVERLNAELESFVYTTSHDLKNPVIALIGYLDVLAEDHGDDFPDEVQHIFARMQVNARHMDSLIRDLLELSRVGRVDVMPDRVDLGLLVDDVAADLASRRPGLRVERDGLPVLWMNTTRARQLFTNLFDNAAAYGGRDDITVHVSSEGLPDGGIRVVVRDDGQGIGEEHLERVFGVFERLDPDGPGGTGMGLAICRRVVEHIGGTMRAVPSDTGATFQIDLPPTAVHVEASDAPAPLEGSTP